MEFIRQYKGLHKEIYYLAILRCINSAGRMFVFPYMSLLLSSVLGFSPVKISYYVLIGSVLNAISNALGGKFSDRYSRRRIVIICYILEITVMLAASFYCRTLYIMPLVLLGNALTCVAAPSISAIVLDKSPYERRSESISLLYLASNIGSALGPVVAGLMFYNHMPQMYLVMATASIITLGITKFRITDDSYYNSPSEEPSIATPGKDLAKGHSQSYLSMLFRNPVLLSFVWVLAMTTLCYSGIGYILPLHFSQLLGVEKGSIYYSYIWTINGLAVVLFTPFIIYLMKKRDLIWGMALGCLLYAFGFGVYAFLDKPSLYYFAVLIWTAAEILFSTGGAVFIAAESPASHKGRAMACYEMARDIGRSVGPLLFGVIIEASSFSTTWKVISSICLFLFVVMLAIYRAWKKRDNGNKNI